MSVCKIITPTQTTYTIQASANQTSIYVCLYMYLYIALNHKPILSDRVRMLSRESLLQFLYLNFQQQQHLYIKNWNGFISHTNIKSFSELKER